MQKLSLQGKYTLITGASSGLGLEMARHVAKDHKGNLVLVARRLDRLEALAVELRAHGVAVVCIQADMTRREDVTRTFEEATRDRAVHAAILNAGVTYFGRAIEHDFEDFERMLAIAEKKKVKKVIFIHGVGQGVLRAEIRSFIKSYYPQCEFLDGNYQKYGHGATEVRFR